MDLYENFKSGINKNTNKDIKKNIFFNIDGFLLNNYNGFTMPYNIIVEFIYEILNKDDLKNKIKNIVSNYYYNDVKSKYKNLKQDKVLLNKRLFLITLLYGYLNKLLIGEFKILNLNENKIIIKMVKNPFSKAYVKKYGFRNECIDFYVEGILEGVFSAFLNNDFICSERVCKSMGAENCLFFLNKK